VRDLKKNLNFVETGLRPVFFFVLLNEFSPILMKYTPTGRLEISILKFPS
jgi:hypothetical protein